MEKDISKTQYVIFHGDINEINTQKLIVICSQAIIEKKEHVYISFSSNGGRVNSGLTLYNTLKSLDIEITFHNVGSVESIAVIVFLAGRNRYIAKNARFLIHEPFRKFTANETLNIARLSELTQQLKNDKKIISNLFEQNISVNKRTIANWFNLSKLLGAYDAISYGLASDIMELQIPMTGNIITVATEIG